MPRQKDESPALPTKKIAATKVAAKRPVGRPKKPPAVSAAAASKRPGRPPKTTVAKSPVKKTIPKAKTSSLVNAKPLSSVSPSHPEQLLYESEMLDEPIRPPKPVEKKKEDNEKQADEPGAISPPRRPVGRPKKNPETQPPLISQPQEQPIAPAVAAPRARAVSLPPSVVKRRRQQRLRRILMIAAAVVVLGAGWYFGIHKSPDVAAENNQLIADIGKRAVLPKDETPSITTVVDETKVNQEFLKNAKKGDKVLLYFQSGQAIVYRPSTGQIVNMGPLETPKPRVFIRQGSLANNIGSVRDAITKTSDFLLASQDQSANKSYTQTVVVDLTGNRPDLAGKLAQMLHVNVAQLPAGEDRPDADLLVIVGSDFK